MEATPAQEADAVVVVKDCPITVVPGFIACVSLDEDHAASRAKMFSVAQKFFSGEKNRSRFGLTEHFKGFCNKIVHQFASA